MKKSILASLMLVSTSLFVSGQDLAPNSVKLKFKSSSEKFRYNSLPELAKYSEYKTYELKLTDINGKEYKSSTQITQNPQIHLTMNYIENLNYVLSEGNLLINVKRTHSSLDNVSNHESSTGGDAPVKLFGYQWDHNDKFHVTITDVKGGSGIVYDTTITVLSTTYFPKDYDSKLTIKNQASVGRYYTEMITKNFPADKKDVTINSAKEAKEKYYDYTFNNTSEASNAIYVPLTKVVNNEVRALFNGLVSRSWSTVIFWMWDVKAKEEEYNEISLAIVTVSEAMNALNENYKNDIYTNFHEENVFTKMDEAYLIFSKYRNDKYILPIKEDIKKEYKSAMDFNTFITALATSRYDEARKIVSELNAEVRSQSNTGLKRSDAQKALAAIQPFIPILEREQRLFEQHKEIYKFYK